MPSVVALRKVAAGLSEYWSPRIVGEVGDSYVKVAKIKGSLTWHSHDEEDELFLVLKGTCALNWSTRSSILEREKCSLSPRECVITPLPRRNVTSFCSSGNRRPTLAMSSQIRRGL